MGVTRKQAEAFSNAKEWRVKFIGLQGVSTMTKDILLVKSKVREYIKTIGDYNVGGDFIDSLNVRVQALIKEATDRTAQNGRKTVQGKDA